VVLVSQPVELAGHSAMGYGAIVEGAGTRVAWDIRASMARQLGRSTVPRPTTAASGSSAWAVLYGSDSRNAMTAAPYLKYRHGVGHVSR
jgi:hypothetical protein